MQHPWYQSPASCGAPEPAAACESHCPGALTALQGSCNIHLATGEEGFKMCVEGMDRLISDGNCRSSSSWRFPMECHLGIVLFSPSADGVVCFGLHPGVLL